MEGRRSLVGIFALSLVLTFFVEPPVKLSWAGVTISEQNLWICLLLGHMYFCTVAYTKGVFNGPPTGTGTTREFLSIADDKRHKRVGSVLDTSGATVAAVLALCLILWGLYRTLLA